MNQLEYGRHSVGGSNYHLQFTPKYRRRVFENARIREECRRLSYEVAEKLGITLECVEFGPDHAHLFVTGCKNHSVSRLAQYFKGTTARYLRLNLWDAVKRYEWGDSFWSDGFFYESIGRVTAETVQFYIEQQQRKHWLHRDMDVIMPCYTSKPSGQAKLDQFLA
jgi:putative transposase